MHLLDTSDDFLICLYREGNQVAIDLLYERYSKFLYGIINEISRKERIYYDYQELFQDAIIVFINCIDKYDEEEGCFYFFVRTAVERKIKDKFKKWRKDNRVCSLDDFVYDNDKETHLDYVFEENSDFSKSQLIGDLNNRLNEENKKIVNMKMAGYTYQEIALMLKISKQCVYRRVTAIKNIIKDIIEKID